MLLAHTLYSPIHFLVRSEKLAKGHTPRFVQDRLFLLAAALPLSYIQFSLDSRIRTCDLLLFILIAVAVLCLIARRLFSRSIHLSYCRMIRQTGLEPVTSALVVLFLIAGVGVYFVLGEYGYRRN